MAETKYREIGEHARKPYREPTILTSPFPGMDEPWSEEAIKAFSNALDLYETDDESQTDKP